MTPTRTLCGWPTSTRASSRATATSTRAKKVYRRFQQADPQPSADRQRRSPTSPPASRSPPVIRNARDGAAEALYGLGGAGTTPGRRTGGADLSAAGAVPQARPRSRRDHRRQSVRGPQAQRRGDPAPIELVPAGSPMRESAEIQVGARARRARPQRRGDGADAATIVAAHPNDPDAWSALGSLQRSAKNTTTPPIPTTRRSH